MRYYGAKTKLLPFIERIVKMTNINGSSSFVDLFSGTSSVGKHFKKLGYQVISNDNLEFAYALSKTYIESNTTPSFKKLIKFLKLKGDIKEILDYLNKIKKFESGFIYSNYSPNGGRKYFSDENALRIDTFRKLIYEWKEENIVNEHEYYYLITSLLKAVNLVSNVSGTYAAYLKTWDKRALNLLKLEPVETIASDTKNKAFKEDANVLIKELQPDILYLDPPYNSRQYASNYFILELIAEGWFDKEPNIYGETGMREYNHQKSKYCSKNLALKTLEELIENSRKSKYIILSYNNEGVIDEYNLKKTLKKIGDFEMFRENHKRYKSINQTEKDPRVTSEQLYLVKPTENKIKLINRTNNLSGKEWLQNSFSIWRSLGKSEEEKKLKHPAIFTIKLITKLIDTYCRPDGGKLLDCFAGSGTTLIAGLMKDKEIVGFDLSSEYKKVFIDRVSKSYGFFSNQLDKNYVIYDSRKLSDKLQSGSVDLCITSPPYWDILNQQRTADNKKNVNYSDDSNDLGNMKDYNEFICNLKEVFSEVYKVLKDKSYFIVNVMDLRKKDKFYPLHIDTARIAKEVNFSFEDIIIWDRQPEYNNMKPLGYPYKFIINKVHEYLLIFRKLPDGKK